MANLFGVVGGATGPFPGISADAARAAQMPQSTGLPTANLPPYGSGATAPASYGGYWGLTPPPTPPHSPRPLLRLHSVGGTTRRDRDERAEDRRAARDASRTERNRVQQ